MIASLFSMCGQANSFWIYLAETKGFEPFGLFIINQLIINELRRIKNY